MQMPPTMLPHELRLLIDPPPTVPPRYDPDGALVGPPRRRRRDRRRLRAGATRLLGAARLLRAVRRGGPDREPAVVPGLLPLYGDSRPARGEQWTRKV